MDTFEPPKYIASLIAAVNDGAKAAQTGALAFALIGLYLLATAFSASDEDLLLDRTLAISQLGAQIPVTVSFAMMPILFIALHVFTLIRYDMLAVNVRQFRTDLETMVPFPWDQERCRQLLANVEFIQALTAPRGSALRSRLYGFMAWIVIAGFPVIVLLAVQINGLRYQSEAVTIVQRICLLADLAVLVWFYVRQRRRATVLPDTRGVTLRRWGVCLWLPVIVVAVDAAWLNIPGPNTKGIRSNRFNQPSATDILSQPLDHFLCRRFNWGCRYLPVDHRTLVGKVWDSKAIVELGAGEPPTKKRLAGFEGIFLRWRTLRFADLSESRLYAADMRDTDLTDADLFRANLTGANLTGATLIRATLTDATLTGATLTTVTLTGATLSGANLTEASLLYTNLTGATLAWATLTDANLTWATLSGATLTDTDLTGANLSRANLSRANLTQANLSRANLTKVLLTGADLTGANLSGANLTGADLIRANLTGAKLTGAKLTEADLTGANLTGACGDGKTQGSSRVAG